jgi:hypothetical protein
MDVEEEELGRLWLIRNSTVGGNSLGDRFPLSGDLVVLHGDEKFYETAQWG